MYILAYDIGTTGVKTCVFALDERIELVASATRGYGLYTLENGGAEQDADEWWDAMCTSTVEVFESCGIPVSEIDGISFCSQMQGVVLVDREGVPVRRPMSYMDQRAEKELNDCMGRGPKVCGANVFKLFKSLRISNAAALSVKDPVWKYKWIENNEPENFKRAYKWLDVKEYLICRCTGEFVMTEDSAYATMIYDTRKGREGFSSDLCKMCGVDMDHLPKVIASTDVAGKLTAKAAGELGLVPGIPVFGGGGDASLIAVGAGCVDIGDTHIYSGTSGWVSTVLDKQMVDVDTMIAAIVGAEKGKYNYFAEMETAGKCLEWVRDHLALDEIGIYLDKHDVAEGHEALYTSLYDYLMETVDKIPAGSGGVIFTPWLHGNRCPFEDPCAAGVFLNIKLETGKTEMIRAVMEGICYHLRWMLECQEKKIKVSDTIRFVGGGALSKVTGQLLSDVTGHRIEIVADPQNVGAIGAAAVVGVGLGVIPELGDVKKFIPVRYSFEPDEANKKIHDRNYRVFRNIYNDNKKNFRLLNGQELNTK